MKSLHVDESGTHTLEPEKLDPTFPFFLLTGIIFEEKDYLKFKKDILALKKEIFGTEKVILHSLELTRTAKAKQPELRILSHPEIRKQFYQKLDSLIDNHTFSILAFAIDKIWYGKQFSASPADPYFLSFNFLFERYEQELDLHEEGSIYAEQRNSRLDRQFLLAWEAAKITMTGEDGIDRMSKLKSHNITKPHIMKKSYENSGLELADLISYRIGRVVQKKANKPAGNEITLDKLLEKIVEIGSLPAELHLKPLRP